MWAGSDARGGVLAEKAATFLRRGTRQNASAGKSTPNLKETIVVVVVVIFESVTSWDRSRRRRNCCCCCCWIRRSSGDHFSTIVNKTNSFFFGK